MSLMTAMGLQYYDLNDKRLFIDSSKNSLKSVYYIIYKLGYRRILKILQYP